MLDNIIGFCIGRMMPPRLHRWYSRRSGWMFAAVWLRDQQRHKWMWVDERRYYSGELQSIHTEIKTLWPR
jgi:hypothetical protein